MKSRWKQILLLVGVVLIVVAAVVVRDLRAQANIGAGYVAHQVCSCVFVSERSHAACRGDLLPVMARVRSEILEEKTRRGVRAGVLALASRTAWHRPGLGCMLD